MYRAVGSAPPIQGTIPFFSTNIWGSSSKSEGSSQTTAPTGIANNSNTNTNGSNNSGNTNSKSRPGTSAGDQPKEHSRRPSFGRKSSFSSPSKGKRRASSSATNGGGGGGGQIITDATAPPALPDYALAAAAKISKDTDALVSPTSVDSFSKMMSRTISAPSSNGLHQTLSGPSATSPQSSVPHLPAEAPSLHGHIHDLANKRISTLGYLRKA
jgi:hypothetical protein